MLDSIPLEIASPSWYTSLGAVHLLQAPSGFWMVYEEGIGTFGGRLQAAQFDFDGNLTGTINLGSATSRLSGDGAFAAAALGDTVLVTWWTLDNTIDMLRFDSPAVLAGEPCPALRARLRARGRRRGRDFSWWPRRGPIP